MQKEFKLQDPGEGIREVDILEVLVSEGDKVEKGQDVLVVESDKAAIELPSPYSGTVRTLSVQQGDTATVGDVLLVVEDGAEASERSEAEEDNAEEQDGDAAVPDESADREREEADDRPGDAEGGEDPEKTDRDSGTESADEDEGAGDEGEGKDGARDQTGERTPVRASPAARKLARERGLDLADVKASGQNDQVTVEDIDAAAPQPRQDGDKSARLQDDDDKSTQDDFGPVERQRTSAIRAATARAMARSWREIPHVMHEDAADITELERWRRRRGDDAPPLTPILARVAATVLRDHPRFNAAFDAESDEIVLRRYCNIAFAVATDRGLVTPVVLDANGKQVRALADEMATLADKARSQKLSKRDISGGTFTITNIGGLGGRGLSPLINAPQTAILGAARARTEPVAVGDIDEGGATETRMILPLVVAFDHRVIDGADAARFTNDLIALLNDPVSLALDT